MTISELNRTRKAADLEKRIEVGQRWVDGLKEIAKTEKDWSEYQMQVEILNKAKRNYNSITN